VYDVRMMRIVSTIQCAIEPYYLKFVPSYTSRVFVVAHVSVCYELVSHLQINLSKFATVRV